MLPGFDASPLRREFAKLMQRAGFSPNSLLHTTGNETKSGTLTLNDSPLMPTAAANDNSTKGATTAYADRAGRTKLASVTAVSNTPVNGVTITIPPQQIDFRSPTLNNGVPNTRTIAASISTVISSGSTGGAINAILARFAILAIDTGSAVEVAWCNTAGGLNLDESNLITTVAEGGAGAADSANVIYSTTARVGVPYKVMGYYDETQAIAGTHSSVLTQVQGVGGQALAALSSLGYGQLPVNVTASRAVSTTYYNTTGKPIIAVVGSVSAGGGTTVTATVNGVALPPQTINVISSSAALTFLIPPGASYSVVVVGTLGVWIEYR